MIQIENHLANLPIVPSVNKFRFTRGSSPIDKIRERKREGKSDKGEGEKNLELHIMNPP